MRSIAETQPHRGYLSRYMNPICTSRGKLFVMARTLSSTALRFHNLAVVLVSTRNPLNIGAGARAMSNFGFRDLRTVNPYELAFREAKSAVGGADVLASAKVCKNVAEAVADCSLVVGTTAARNRQLGHPLKSLPDGAPLIRQALRSGRVGLMFGSEKRGLSNEELSYCHWLLRVPTVETGPSMNLGQAVAVCLYEMSRASASTISGSRKSVANTTELERLASVLIDALRASGYAKAETKSFEKTARQLVRRFSLSSGDAHILLGMLRQMRWKMEKG